MDDYDYNADKLVGEVLGVFKTLKGAGVKNFGFSKPDPETYERLLQGTISSELLPELLKDAKKVTSEFGDHYVAKINGVEHFIEPDDNPNEDFERSFLLRVADTSSLLKNLVTDMNLSTISFDPVWRTSKKLKDYFSEKGLKLYSPGESLSWGNLSEVEKEYIESMGDVAMDLPESLHPPGMDERIEQLEKMHENIKQLERREKEREMERKERERNARRASYEKWVPRVGYEKKGQFDPRPSVYSPPVNLEFEERLRVKLRLV